MLLATTIELPLGDNGNFNLRGALEKFLQSFAAKDLLAFSEMEETVNALASNDCLLTGLRNGCGFCNLETKRQS